MRRIAGAILGLCLCVAVGAAALVWSGAISVAANDPHWRVTRWVMETARVRSIKAHTVGITPPGDLADRARIVGGASHFAEHCAGCHSAPGVPAEDMAEGMYPKPPVLTGTARRWTPAELFWIVRNGIKMTGMPSWADHGDDALWDIVAFLEKLPGISEQEYGQLVTASMQAGGHQSMQAGGHHMHGASGMEMGHGNAAPDEAGRNRDSRAVNH